MKTSAHHQRTVAASPAPLLPLGQHLGRTSLQTEAWALAQSLESSFCLRGPGRETEVQGASLASSTTPGVGALLCRPAGVRALEASWVCHDFSVSCEGLVWPAAAYLCLFSSSLTSCPFPAVEAPEVSEDPGSSRPWILGRNCSHPWPLCLWDSASASTLSLFPLRNIIDDPRLGQKPTWCPHVTLHRGCLLTCPLHGELSRAGVPSS